MNMTIVSLVGIMIGFLAVPALMRRAPLARVGLAVALVFVHVFVAQVYFAFTQSNMADAYAYYYAGNYWRQYPWTALSTPFIGHVTQLLKVELGATYLDCFMVFQAFGTWGLILLLRSFQEIHEKMQTPEYRLPLFLLFVPSIHFWTSAIGKDAPVFFAVALATWAALNISKRTIAFIFAVFVMVLVRAHIALAVVLALLATSILSSQLSTGRKVMLILVGLTGAVVVLSSIQATFRVDLTDASSVSNFWDDRAAAEAADKSSTSIVGSSYAVRLISLLFRPFFFDAKNAFGLIASLENVGALLLTLFLFKHLRDIRYLMKRVTFVSFATILSVVLILVLSVLNYNIGLGLRMRTMIMPPLFCLLAALQAFIYLKKRAAAMPPPPPRAAMTRPVAGFESGRPAT